MSATLSRPTSGKTSSSASDLFFQVHQEIDIDASLATVFASILEQMGPDFKTMEGQSLQLKLEAWPGGRWYRDLGDKTGHLWGHVQVIKPPKLIEICGPLMMSYPAVNHVQYRLTEQANGTRLTFTHRAMGDVAAEHREGMPKGWGEIMARIKKSSER